MTGYLKSISVQKTKQGTSCQLAIPNEEIHTLYRKIIEQWLSHGYGRYDYLILSRDVNKFSIILEF